MALATAAVGVYYGSPILGGLVAWWLQLPWTHALWLWLPLALLGIGLPWISRQFVVASILVESRGSTWADARASLNKWRELYRRRAQARRHPQIEQFQAWHATLAGKATGLTFGDFYDDADVSALVARVKDTVDNGVALVRRVDPPDDEDASAIYFAASRKTWNMLAHEHYLKVWVIGRDLAMTSSGREARNQLDEFAFGFLHALLAKAVHELDPRTTNVFPTVEDSVIWMERLRDSPGSVTGTRPMGGEAVEGGD